jgi:hypothetical protein
LKDLDFIDQPLAPKRLRAKKSDKCLKLLTVSNQSSVGSNEHSSSTNDSDEEKRRRKNKDQVKIL